MVDAIPQSRPSGRTIRATRPRKRGPKGAHKLTEAVLDFVRTTRSEEPDLPFEALIERIAQHFGICVHRRTLERALVRSKKKRHRLDK